MSLYVLIVGWVVASFMLTPLIGSAIGRALRDGQGRRSTTPEQTLTVKTASPLEDVLEIGDPGERAGRAIASKTPRVSLSRNTATGKAKVRGRF